MDWRKEAQDVASDMYDIEGWTPKPVTMEVQFMDVDPEVLGILTGGVMGNKPDPTFAVEVVAPIKRTFWQWLRRRPVQHMRYYIPNARLVDGAGEPDA